MSVRIPSLNSSDLKEIINKMICNENGLVDSYYYFFTPSAFYESFGYYVTVCGHFHASTGYEIRRGGGVVPLLFFIKSGRLSLQYENHSYIAKKGQIVLINCNRPHSYHCQSDCEFLFFHLAGNNTHEITDQLINVNGSILFDLADAEPLFDKAQFFLDLLYEDFPVSEAHFSAFLYEALCHLQVRGMENLMQKDSTKSSMSKVLSYIRENVKESVDLESLSKIASMSKYHFLRCFKKEFSVTPFQYITELKISLAKTMLTATEMNITDIAFDLGYSNESSFIRAFTRVTGISPLRFKKQSFLQ